MFQPPIAPVFAVIVPDKRAFDAVMLPFIKWKFEPLISTVSPLSMAFEALIVKLLPINEIL